MAVAAKVKVLKDGLYLKPNLRSQKAGEGDEILVLGGTYAESLEADGLAEVIPFSPPTEEGSPASEEDDAPTAPSGEEGLGLVAVSGIGEAMEKKLETAGIDSLEALVAADTAVVAVAAGVSEAKAADWQAQAAKLIDGG